MLISTTGQMFDYEIKREFPIKIRRVKILEPGPSLKSHWHEEMMIFFIEKGQAIVHCNSRSIPVGPQDVVIINSNDIHYLENCCDELIECYLIIDFSFLLSKQDDVCQTKYITPLLEKSIVFQNRISHDLEINRVITGLVEEYEQQSTGYELAVKSNLYRLLVLLLRSYTVPATEQRETKRQYNLSQQIRPILEYIDNHYTEKISLESLAQMAHLSRHHFCRLFKTLTGLPPIEYVNHLRIDSAAELLKGQELSVSEIAMAVGFNDSNYFSRLFKKYKNHSPICFQHKYSSEASYDTSSSGKTNSSNVGRLQ